MLRLGLDDENRRQRFILNENRRCRFDHVLRGHYDGFVRRFHTLRCGLIKGCWRGGWFARRTFAPLTSATIAALLAIGTLWTS